MAQFTFGIVSFVVELTNKRTNVLNIYCNKGTAQMLYKCLPGLLYCYLYIQENRSYAPGNGTHIATRNTHSLVLSYGRGGVANQNLPKPTLLVSFHTQFKLNLNKYRT